jgi:hypothetical protein
MIVRGSIERLTPVLMTALGGVCLTPLLLAADAPGRNPAPGCRRHLWWIDQFHAARFAAGFRSSSGRSASDRAGALLADDH